MKKILLIEDNELVADIYKRKFEAAGFAVQVEGNGSEGYYRIFKMHPDAVLLDLLLPGMDGPSIIRKFRAQREFAHLPIIVFTNAYLSDVGRDAVSAGATQVFNKATAEPREIIEAVVNALNKSVKAPEDSPIGLLESPREYAPVNILEESPFHSPSSFPPTVPDAEGNPIQPAKQPKSSWGAPADQRPQPVDAPPKDELDNEVAFQSLAQEEFLRKSGGRIEHLRNLLCHLKANAMTAREVGPFLDMAQIAHTLSGHAAIVGLHYLAHLAAALEALARELFECPSQFSIPTRRTIAKAIDMMARLVDFGSSCKLKEFSQFNVLVVDDEKIARAMISRTISRAKLAYVATGRPETALELLQENEFDLVILDVKMEGMSGFELCAALRKMDHYLHCPVVFVSSLSDFHSKIVSLQSGGNDFIVKPFAPVELELKVLLYMIGAQLIPETVPKGSAAEAKTGEEIPKSGPEIS